MIHEENASTAHRRREDKTNAVLDAAMELVSSQGLEGLTLQRVAQRLGMVTTALYRYFDSKDALVAALQRRAVAAIHAQITKELGRLPAALGRVAPEVRAVAPLLRLARVYVSLPRTRTDDFRLLSMLIGDSRVLVADQESARAVPLVMALLTDVAALFEFASTVGALEKGDTVMRTLALWATLHGLGQLDKLHRVAPHMPQAVALADEAVGALLRGFGADGNVVSRARRALSRVPPLCDDQGAIISQRVEAGAR